MQVEAELLETVFCPFCSQPNAGTAKFCKECGGKIKALKESCPDCRTQLRDGAKFCSKCGAKAASKI